ncbi:helix-turn-helix domain-containing protein [Vibrio ordalii]|uniref:helix-turn-helix domain-containing protein n=1 Tax=Vibrio ordalii TaxID=28174 RepID=UPI000319F314|nr:helix-turn-helix transcriptional regulator [Vibrio ordalii]OEE72383.1 hypothetical protein A1QQ_06780 [Vibrio ordalii FF-167]
MKSSREEEMTDTYRAERIKEAILTNGTYEEIADKTGIGSRTLLRIATGKTEPKFSDVITIAKTTNTPLEWIAYGQMKDIEVDAVKSFEQTLNGSDKKTDEAYRTIIWNLSKLYKEDIQSLDIQIQALSKYRENQRKKEKEKYRKKYITLLAKGPKFTKEAEMSKDFLMKEFQCREEELSESNLALEILAEKKKIESYEKELEEINKNATGIIRRVGQIELLKRKYDM